MIRSLAIAALALVATPAAADPLQEQVLAGLRASRDTDWAFTRRTTIERTGAARKIFIHRFDPRRAIADRWTLLSVDGRAPTAKEVAQARKMGKQPIPHYGESAKWFGAPAVRAPSASGTATYRFARLPAGTLKLGPKDASANISAEAIVNTAGRAPFVQQVRLTSTGSFRMALVAKVGSLSFRSRYRPAADGRPVPAELTGDMSGSVLGKSGELRTSITYSDFIAAR